MSVSVLELQLFTWESSSATVLVAKLFPVNFKIGFNSTFDILEGKSHNDLIVVSVLFPAKWPLVCVLNVPMFSPFVAVASECRLYLYIFVSVSVVITDRRFSLLNSEPSKLPRLWYNCSLLVSKTGSCVTLAEILYVFVCSLHACQRCI